LRGGRSWTGCSGNEEKRAFQSGDGGKIKDRRGQTGIKRAVTIIRRILNGWRGKCKRNEWASKIPAKNEDDVSAR